MDEIDVGIFEAGPGGLSSLAQTSLQDGVVQTQQSQLSVCNALKLGKTSASHNVLNVGDVVSGTHRL